MTGGVQFDRADVAATLDDAKGYTLYFQNYLDSSAFTNPERQLIQSLLPTLRDWYVQAGPSGMNVIDAQNRGAFMLGGRGADVLTGGSQTDLLVGNAGADRLNGGGGNDVLLGGAGFDTYIYNAGDGTDQIEDRMRRKWLLVNGQMMVGGASVVQVSLTTRTRASDGQYTFVHSGSTLTINGQITIQDWQPGEFGVTLRDLSTLPTGTPAVIDYNNGWETETLRLRFHLALTMQGGLLCRTPLKIMWSMEQAGHDLIMTDPGHPALYGGNEVVNAGDGSDYIIGNTNDRLFGEAGDDVIKGGRGQDVLDGGEGHDFLLADYVDAPGANDYLDGGADDDALLGGTGDDILLGGDGDDQIFADDIAGYATRPEGRDYVDGGAGDDWASGGLGDDVLLGGADKDRLYGDNAPVSDAYVWTELPWVPVGTGFPPDAFFQGFTFSILPGVNPAFHSMTGGSDYLEGGAGDDYLQGDAGNDVLLGGTENDTLYGDDLSLDEVTPGNDLLDGGAGNDDLFGGGGTDTLLGGAGNDELYGDFTNDPTGGKDWLDGGAGNDTLAGGQGDDVIFGGANQDLLVGNQGQDILDGGSGNDELQGGAGVDVLRGGTGEDYLFGEDGADTLFGDEGSDNLSGDAGEDVLIGGSGADVLVGGAGVDTYLFNLGDGVDTIVDAPGEGNKLVFGPGVSGQDISLGLGSLLVRVGSNGDAIHIQGFDPADPTQSAGIDVFEFADGTTLTHTELIARGFDLVGTAGDDVLNGGETYRGIFGLDGNDALTGGAIDNVLDGGDGNDVIIGNGGVDQLSGGTGDDIMQGGDGNDVLKGDAGNDRLEGEAGDDTIDAGTGDDLVNAGAGNDTVLGGEGNDTIFAGTGDDTAAGGAGDDTVYGQGGTDVVDGGTGNDLFVGAPGSYSYAFGTGSGHDIIDSSQGGSYIIQMSAGVLPSDVIVGRVDRTITLSLNGGFDTLTLPSFYENHSFHVQFADKTVWDANSIHNQAGGSLQVGTKGSDFILGYNGFPDELIGLAGDDGYAVNDLGDVVVEAPDEGHDGVVSTVDFTLPDNVEDLTLSDPFALYDLVGPVVLHVDPAAVFATGNALNNVLSGNSFDNVLTGGAGDDTLNGGQLIYGNLISTHNDDTLTGGPGNDTYYFSAFYGGVDTIIDQSSTGESNTLIFSDLSYFGSDPLAGFHLRLDGTTLVMQMDIHPFSIVENTREVRFPNFNPNDAYGSHAIDVFDFQDGTLLSYQQIIDLGIDVQGTSQDDIVTGTNAPNRIHGGAGDDTLLGGPRNDIYLFDRGDGVDTIVDTAVAGAMNEIRFGTGLSLGDLEVVQEANSLTIQTGPNGDTIVLSNYDPAGQTGSSVIGSITFTNGLHLSLDELVNFSGGTDGNDTFSGTDGVDRYNAKGGNDVVTGGGGNDLLLGGSGQDDLKGDTGNDQLFGGYDYDTLTGGIGDDTLDGGAGADVYVFNPGDGHDVILDRADSGGNNRLLFGPGITLSDLLFNQDYGGQFGISINGINIIINGIYVGSNGDRIDLPNFRDVPQVFTPSRSQTA